MSLKNPLTPAGIEPATFRFVAQHLNHCATAVPHSRYIRIKYYMAYRFGFLVFREMSDKEYVGVLFIGATLNLQMLSIIGFGL